MKTLFLSALTLIVLTLSGCGSGHNSDPPPLFNTQILSDAALDGDIVKPFVGGTVAITQGLALEYSAGFDSVAEWRAFLQFPLDGVGGVPAGAAIQSATLDLLVFSTFTSAIPIRIELVDLDLGSLVPDDFDLTQALATTTILVPTSQTSFGQHVFVDVTALMQRAQDLGLPIFQVRILVDPAVTTPGFIDINDARVDRATLAPLLDVNYFY